MRQFTLNLLEKYNKPIVYLENFFKIRALLDTGADLPVWTIDESKLEKIGGIKIKSNVSFGGWWKSNRQSLSHEIFPTWRFNFS